MPRLHENRFNNCLFVQHQGPKQTAWPLCATVICVEAVPRAGRRTAHLVAAAPPVHIVTIPGGGPDPSRGSSVRLVVHL